MKKLVLLTSYLMLLPLLIFSLALYSLFFLFSSNLGRVQAEPTQYRTVAEAGNDLNHIPEVKEARLTKLSNYLVLHKSPLMGYEQFIIKTADEYNLDYRLTTAIAMAESTLCRNEHSNTHNCWGYGITGGKITWFQSYEDAIKEVSRSLSESYGGHGLYTPHEIVTRYNPGSTTWADKVSKFMTDIDNSL